MTSHVVALFTTFLVTEDSYARILQVVGFEGLRDFWLLLTSWALLGVSGEDRDEEPGLRDGVPVLSLPPCPRAGAWDGPLWEGSEAGRDGHGLKPSFAGQGRGRRSCKPMRAAALLRCGARECSESSVQLFV